MSKSSTDANDYSRFKDIVDSDEEKEASAKKAAPVPASSCRNCSKDDAKLKCSICKKATYCNRQCQTSDWTYHRRICKKPEDKAKEDAAAAVRSKPRTPEGAAAAASGSSSSPSSKSTASSSTKATKPVRREVVKEDEDLENARGYKNGLPYFHREQSEHEKSLIGDIAPKKIEEVPELAATTAVNHDGSAWNTAGTFEQRDFTSWAQDRLKALLSNVEVTARSFTVRGGDVKDIKGDASVCVVRGKKRFLFDFEFHIEWTVVGKDGYKGKLTFHDISNDGDYEIGVQYKKKPSDPLELKELAEAVNGQAEGLRHTLVQRVAAFVAEYQAL